MKCLLFILLLFNFSCGKFGVTKKSSQEKQDVSKIYASGNLRVAVFYEEGAEPYAGGVQILAGLADFKVWSVLETNLKALFPGKNVTVPKELSEMSKLSEQNQTVWSLQELDALGNSMGQTSSGNTTIFNIFFLKGISASSPNVIGVHLSGTKTLAIFKEVIQNHNVSTLVQRYVEQATLVHEIGHAVGLVNNGTPLTSNHEDAGHRAHCNNPNCVMYWQNEGLADLIQFAQSRSNQPDLVMFDQACLKDVTSHK